MAKKAIGEAVLQPLTKKGRCHAAQHCQHADCGDPNWQKVLQTRLEKTFTSELLEERTAQKIIVEHPYRVKVRAAP
jgi:hypothetical protein